MVNHTLLSKGILFCFCFMIFSGCSFNKSNEENEGEKAKDWEAVAKLMDYINAHQVVQRSVFNNAYLAIFKDTALGLNRNNNKFFVQSLTNPTYYKEFLPGKDAPSALKKNADNMGILPRLHIKYFKNKCVYLVNTSGQIDKICVDGSHEAILTQEAIQKSRGGGLGYKNAFSYQDGVIFRGNASGIFGFSEKTGKIVFKWEHEVNDFYDRYYFFKVTDGVLVIGDYREDKTINMVAFDVENFSKLWERKFNRKFNGAYTADFECNAKGLCALSLREKVKSFFINIYSGHLISSTNHHVKTSEGGPPIFSTITDSTALIRTEGNKYGSFNFREDKMSWESKQGTYYFSVNNYVISRERKPKITPKEGKGPFKSKKYYVIGRNSGEVLKTINVNKDYPVFVRFSPNYIRIEDKIYRVKQN